MYPKLTTCFLVEGKPRSTVLCDRKTKRKTKHCYKNVSSCVSVEKKYLLEPENVPVVHFSTPACANRSVTWNRSLLEGQCVQLVISIASVQINVCSVPVWNTVSVCVYCVLCLFVSILHHKKTLTRSHSFLNWNSVQPLSRTIVKSPFGALLWTQMRRTRTSKRLSWSQMLCQLLRAFRLEDGGRQTSCRCWAALRSKHSRSQYVVLHEKSLVPETYFLKLFGAKSAFVNSSSGHRKVSSETCCMTWPVHRASSSMRTIYLRSLEIASR